MTRTSYAFLLAFLLFTQADGISLLKPIASREPAASAQEEDFRAGLNAFNAHWMDRQKHITHKKHLPLLLEHGRKTRYSVLLMHGLYESPYFIKGIARAFHHEGFNVVSILLTGHWTNPMRQLDRVSFRDWLKDRERGLEIAKLLGEEVLLAGYSAGGLLAIEGALAHPEVRGVFAFAPALKLSGTASIASLLGTLFGRSGNDHFDVPEDGDEIAYFSPGAGMEVEKLIQELLWRHSHYWGGDGSEDAARRTEAYGRLRAPVFLSMPEDDDTADTRESLSFFSEVSSPKKLLYFSEKNGYRHVNHDNIVKDSEDVYARDSSSYNPYFRELRRTLSEFIREHYPVR